MRRLDVAIVGGGPAGLAVAIGAARRGLSTLLLERGEYPLDKACGEGVMPAGVRALSALGALPLIPASERSELHGVRYVQEGGASVEGFFRAGQAGLGVRRTALVQALLTRARQEGVTVLERHAVRSHHRLPSGIELRTDDRAFQASIVVAADGLLSALRAKEGLAPPAQKTPGQSRRFGLRQHFRRAPWTSLVEVHLADGVEAYVTPCGPRRVGVAFLWDLAQHPAGTTPDFAHFLERFPFLQSRLMGAAEDSAPRGAGPLAQRSLRCVTNRLVLVGDAAGYVDAITGEGLSLAFESAEALCRVLPGALAQEGAQSALLDYERDHRALFRRYAWAARGVLALARRPALRRAVLGALAWQPSLFESLLRTLAGGLQSPVELPGAAH